MAALPPLVASMVQQYLSDYGYIDTLRQFEKEAAPLLRLWAQRQGAGQHQLTDLCSALSEYVTLWEKEQRLLRLTRQNPLAAELAASLDRHSRLQVQMFADPLPSCLQTAWGHCSAVLLRAHACIILLTVRLAAQDDSDTRGPSSSPLVLDQPQAAVPGQQVL